MRVLISFMGIIFILFIAGCAGPEPGETVQATLPDPNVMVIIQPTPTTNLPTDPAPAPEPTLTGTAPAAMTEMAFGLESHKADFQDHSDLLGKPGLVLMRHNGLMWHVVEPVEGERDWAVLSDLEGKLERADASGLSTILIIRGTPEWAQLISWLILRSNFAR